MPEVDQNASRGNSNRGVSLVAPSYKRKHYKGKLVTKKSLAMDMGSSGLRIVHFHDYDGTHIHRIVKHDPSPEEISMGHEDTVADLSMAIYPYPDNRSDEIFGVYYGNARHPYRKSVSAKLVFYLLADRTDKMMEGFHQLEELQHWAKENEENSNLILWDGLRQIMTKAFANARKAIFFADNGASRDPVDTISATIPAQWDLDYEDIFGALIYDAFQEVFGYELQRVVFHTEAQIGLHYLFTGESLQGRSDLSQMDVELDKLKKHTNIILNVDFGHHTMNTALMSVVRDTNGNPSLLEIVADEGTSAGTGAWAHEVLRLLMERYHDRTGNNMPSLMQIELIADFDLKKNKFSDAKATQLYTEDHGSGEQCFAISAEETVITFNRAYEIAQQLLEKQLIIMLADYKDHCEIIKAVVGGCSSKHKMVRKWVNDLCKEYGVEVFYLNKVGYEQETARLALGSSYATATAISVEEFADTAAFGIMAKMSTVKVNGRLEYTWTDSAWAIWYKTGAGIPTGVDIAFTVTGDSSEEFNYAAYDLLHMTGFPKGRIFMRFEIDVVANEITLTFLKEVRKRVGKMHKVELEQIGFFTAAVMVCPGSRVLTIFEEDNDGTPEAPGFSARLKATISGLKEHFPDKQPPDIRRIVRNPRDEGECRDGAQPTRSQPKRKAKEALDTRLYIEEDIEMADMVGELGRDFQPSPAGNRKGRPARVAVGKVLHRR